jgi:hypothetical protein
VRYRITDSRMADDELILELDVDQFDDPDEPEVDEDEARELLDWWTSHPGRAYEVLEDGGYIIVVQIEGFAHGPMIGTWSQETSDTTWPLSGFPYTSLSYEEYVDGQVKCPNCGEFVDGPLNYEDKPYRMCDSCEHNARRSGWEPGDE